MSDPKFLQAFGPLFPLEARRLAVALGNRELYKETMAVLPPKGDYRYGDNIFHSYLNQLEVPTEQQILRDALRKYPGLEKNPNFTSNNNAALRFCTRHNYDLCVRVLLQNPDVNVNANRGEPLYYALRNQNLNMVKLLLDKGAIINSTETEYNSLRLAIYTNNLELIKFFITKYKDLDETAQEIYFCFLHISFEVFYTIIQYFIEKYLNNPNYNNLEISSEIEIVLIAHIQLNHNISVQQHIELINFVFNQGVNLFGHGNTLLRVTCEKDDSYLPLVQVLIGMGFQVNKAAIKSAEYHNNKEIARYLLSLVPVNGIIPNL